MNTWQELVREFNSLKKQVTVLESRLSSLEFQKPQPQLPYESPEPPKRGRPRKYLEGEES